MTPPSLTWNAWTATAPDAAYSALAFAFAVPRLLARNRQAGPVRADQSNRAPALVGRQLSATSLARRALGCSSAEGGEHINPIQPGYDARQFRNFLDGVVRMARRARIPWGGKPETEIMNLLLLLAVAVPLSCLAFLSWLALLSVMTLGAVIKVIGIARAGGPQWPRVEPTDSSLG
jgi:hypothetical protein